MVETGSPGIREAIERVAGEASARAHKKPTQSFDAFRTHARTRIRTDRGQFDFAGYRPLAEISRVVVRDDAERVAIQKPTQRGFTTIFGFGLSHWQAERNGRNVLYFLPTNELAKDVARNRFVPAIGGGTLDEPMQGKQSGVVYSSTSGKTVYFLGLDTARNAISRPADVLVWDEVDDIDQENLEMSRQRLDASPYAHELAFCCGRYPGEGINALYRAGDRRRWLVRCPGCGHDHVPEDAFPGNMIRVDEAWRTCCPKCLKPVDFETQGRFVAESPDERGRISFAVSTLAFGCTDMDRLMREWSLAQGDRRALAAFRCSKLATPDAGDRTALTAEIVARATRPRTGAIAVPPKYIGIDVGDACHAALAGMDGEGVGFVGFARMRPEDVLDWLAAQDAACPFEAVVIDQKPEGSLAREVCRRFPGRAWMQEFRRGDEQESAKTLEGESFPKLTMERDVVIEHFCDRVKAAAEGKHGATFPEMWDGVPFAQSAPARHIVTGSQREEKTNALGLTELRFRSGKVENHWLMACVFAHAAVARVGSRGISEVRVSGATLRTADVGIRERRARVREMFL